MEISEASIATFVNPESNDGKVKGLKPGKVTLTAKLSGNPIATAELTVRGDGSHQSTKSNLQEKVMSLLVG